MQVGYITKNKKTRTLNPTLASSAPHPPSRREGDKVFQTSESGLRFLELREGDGPMPKPGQTVVVDWVGYTEGYKVGRCKLDPGLKAPWFQKFNLMT